MRSHWLFQMVAVFGVTACLWADEKMPQDAWYKLTEWGSSGSGDGKLNQPYGVVVTPEGHVFVTEIGNNRVQVFNLDGEFVRKFGSQGSGNGQFNSPHGIALGPDGLVYVADRNNYRIQVFTQTGTYVRKWGSQGSGDGQFNWPVNVCVAENGRVYVSDYYNARIQAFDSNGVFVLKWGSYGGEGGQFTRPFGVTVARNGQVYVADRQYDETPGVDSGPKGPGRIQVFDANGGYITTWRAFDPYAASIGPDGLLYATLGDDGSPRAVYVYTPDGVELSGWECSYDPNGVGVALDGRVYSTSTGGDRIQVMGRTYRSPRNAGVVPMPVVCNVEVRAGAPILDVDYVVLDTDSSVVHTEGVAFAGGTNSLKNFINMSSFVEGTEANIGTNALANVTNRVSWDLGADWDTNYVDVSVSMLANDSRGLIDVAFISLPESGTNGALTISQSPVTQSDLIFLWYWLLSVNEPGMTLVDGKIYGTTAPYQGVLFADDSTTSQSGRAFLFGKCGYREATTDELSRARTGPSGVVNAWDLRDYSLTAGPGVRPRKTNEYGFDTGDWGSSAWWLVKE